MRATEIANSCIATLSKTNVSAIKAKMERLADETLGKTSLKQRNALLRACVVRLRKHGVKI